MKVKLTNVRLSFPDLFEAVQFQGQGPFNYRASFLMPAAGNDAKAAIANADGKTYQATGPALGVLNSAIEQVAKEKWGAKAGPILNAARAQANKCCLVDGNTKAYDGYADHWALSATRPQDKGRPAVIDQNKQPLVAADGKPYAGCYVNATVEVWAQDNNYGKAIRATLVGVQFVRDGDAFGGGSAPSADDFDEIAEGAGADALV